MPKHYVYRMDHDVGFAPRVHRRACTLCGCKTTTVEQWAEPGSWVVGIGGLGTGRPDALIYAMRVNSTPSYREFSSAPVNSSATPTARNAAARLPLD